MSRHIYIKQYHKAGEEDHRLTDIKLATDSFYGAFQATCELLNALGVSYHKTSDSSIMGKRFSIHDGMTVIEIR